MVLFKGMCAYYEWIGKPLCSQGYHNPGVKCHSQNSCPGYVEHSSLEAFRVRQSKSGALSNDRPGLCGSGDTPEPL